MNNLPKTVEENTLPQLLREIADATNLGRALATAAEVGGQRLYVPKRPTRDSALVKRVGLDVALVLADAYGGEFVEFPRGVAATVAQRKRNVLDSNGSANKLAADNGMTRRRVHQIRAEAGRPANPNQRTLFDN